MYENYKQLACAVILRALEDYNKSKGKNEERAIRKLLQISDIWFDITDIDRNVFYEKILGGKYDEFR